DQAVAILRQLQDITGRYSLVFAGANPQRPMSENTVNKALRQMGYEGRQTGHGFRHLLSPPTVPSGGTVGSVGKTKQAQKKFIHANGPSLS
ncbi:hypothetical protein Q6271_27695, partial [Klebsiella pneumoniae]|nr:hypothetical protein [Klebsiella pneumoniae]